VDFGHIAGAPHEWSSGKGIGGVGIGSGVEEKAHSVHTAEGGCVHKRRVAVSVGGVGPRIANELPESGEIVVSDGQVERAVLSGLAENRECQGEECCTGNSRVQFCDTGWQALAGRFVLIL
jgi:hypothetical protein